MIWTLERYGWKINRLTLLLKKLIHDSSNTTSFLYDIVLKKILHLVIRLQSIQHLEISYLTFPVRFTLICLSVSLFPSNRESLVLLLQTITKDNIKDRFKSPKLKPSITPWVPNLYKPWKISEILPSEVGTFKDQLIVYPVSDGLDLPIRGRL